MISMRRHIGLVTAMLALSGLPSAQAGELQGREAVVPVTRVQLARGGRYFALPVRIGSRNLSAAIDTGSAGLRVLAPALGEGDARSTGQSSAVTFGSGTTISGERAWAQLSFGSVSGQALIEVVRRVSCSNDHPDCREGHLPLNELGMMGSGVPGQGAPAIIGLARSDIPVTVPFPALGVQRWILALPNDVAPGRLVLNPSPREREGFIAFGPPVGPDGKPRAAIRGCLRNNDTGRQLCGIISFDTGSAGISVSSPGPLPKIWPNGTSASLLYQDDAGRTRLVQTFRTGDPSHSSRFSFDDHPSGQQTVIHANSSPYLCFDVMYEAAAGPISLRPRASGPRDPQARAAAPDAG